MIALRRSQFGIRGKALLLVLTMIAIVGGVLAGAFHYTGSMAYSLRREILREQVEAAAYAGSEFLFAKWKQIPSANGGALPTEGDLAQIPAPSPELHPMFAESGITFDEANVTLADVWGKPIKNGKSNGKQSNSSPAESRGFAQPRLPGLPGWSGYGFHYRAEVRASGPRSAQQSSPPTVTVVRDFHAATVPIFQALMFLESDLVLHAAEEFTLNGKIHTNGNARILGHRPVRLLGQLSYAGEYLEAASPNSTSEAFGEPTESPRWSDGLPSTASLTKAAQLSRVERIEFLGVPAWSVLDPENSNPNDDSLREIIEFPESSADDPAPIAQRRLANQAHLIITVDSSKPANDAARVSIQAAAHQPSISNANASSIRAAVRETIQFPDPRLARAISVTDVDLSALSSALASTIGRNAKGDLPGVIVYLRDASGSASAFRMVNGAEIASPLTVATPNLLYVQGDVNTGGGVASNKPNSGHNPSRVPSNDGGNPDGSDSSIATGYTKQPLAFAADSITVLSNAWNDTSIQSPMSLRIAAHTTLNAAFITGRTPHDSQNPAASVHQPQHLLHLLENWQGKDFTFHGSLVQLFESRIPSAVSNPDALSIAPQRRWSHDRSLVTNPPPGQLEGRVFIRGRWVSH